MTDDKILEVIDFLETDVNVRWPKIKPAEKKFLAVQGLLPEHVAHIKTMFPRMREMLVESQSGHEIDRAARREKVMRWLGFIQGWFWAGGAFSIDELGRMNMPDEENV